MNSDPAALAGLTALVAATLRIAAPLLVAALGELLVERGGMINLGLEGAMLSGALAAALASPVGGPWAGLALGILVGMVLGAMFGVVAIRFGADQIIAGTAFTLAGVGLTGAVYRGVFGGVGPGLSIPLFPAAPVPGLAALPIVGPVFRQPLPVYGVLILVPAAWWLLYRTSWGLRLRAAGEAVDAARASGVRVGWVRFGSLVLGGAAGGAGGALLVLAQVGTFAERMTAGRGFIAIALVVLGRWHPVGVLLAAVLFGAVSALQFVLQASGYPVPYQLFLALPYLATLAALAIVRGRVVAPGTAGGAFGISGSPPAAGASARSG